MPIYAYKCGSCGHAKDVLQKLSDPPLAVCPACGAAAFSKQLTSAGFHLKGSGWYATDFKGGSKPVPTSEGEAGKTADGAKTEGAKSDGAKTDSAKTDGAKTDGAKPADGAGKKPAQDGPAPTKSGAPAASSGGCGSGCGCH
jgi:putative FmdB family regulatory protein